jgi:hypothetical protein
MRRPRRGYSLTASRMGVVLVKGNGDNRRTRPTAETPREPKTSNCKDPASRSSALPSIGALRGCVPEGHAEQKSPHTVTAEFINEKLKHLPIDTLISLRFINDRGEQPCI